MQLVHCCSYNSFIKGVALHSAMPLRRAPPGTVCVGCRSTHKAVFICNANAACHMHAARLRHALKTVGHITLCTACRQPRAREHKPSVSDMQLSTLRTKCGVSFYPMITNHAHTPQSYLSRQNRLKQHHPHPPTPGRNVSIACCITKEPHHTARRGRTSPHWCLGCRYEGDLWN